MTTRRREHFGVPLLLALLLATAPAGHRAKAERAEALGHMAVAAQEYEAAWTEEQAPELLYRLGIVRRKLKQYGKAREAFRAYLREAPEGGLRDEVERQLAKLEVLIEAQSEDFTDPAPRRAAPPPPSEAPELPVRIPPPPPAPPVVVEARPLAAVPADAMPSVPRLETAHRSAGPWLAAGAVAVGAAGAYLWWDGARLSRALDARYAAGDLTRADVPSYSRVRTESLAGRLLVAAGVALAAGAVALW